MPTYEYRCTNCDEDLEVVQSFSDEPLTECPTCGGRLRKVFSPVGIVFKGTGFYKTDSRGGKSGSVKPKEKEKETSSSSSSDSSSSKSDSSSPSSSADGSSKSDTSSKKDSKIA
jgi:putative FmdB family regulatory protein